MLDPFGILWKLKLPGKDSLMLVNTKLAVLSIIKIQFFEPYMGLKKILKDF
jgi:hypothetical protein